MKLEANTQLAVLPDKVWNLLFTLDNYPSWNPVFKSVEGALETDGKLKIRLCIPGKRPETRTALVTAVMLGKYLSFQVASPIGGWWLNTEYVFRLKPASENKTLFIAECFCYGIALRFSRSRIKRELTTALSQIVREFKDICES